MHCNHIFFVLSPVEKQRTPPVSLYGPDSDIQYFPMEFIRSRPTQLEIYLWHNTICVSGTTPCNRPYRTSKLPAARNILLLFQLGFNAIELVIILYAMRACVRIFVPPIYGNGFRFVICVNGWFPYSPQ